MTRESSPKPSKRRRVEDPVCTEDVNTIAATGSPQWDGDKVTICGRPTLLDIYPACLFEALEHAKIKDRFHHLCDVCEPVFSHLLGPYEARPLYDPHGGENLQRDIDIPKRSSKNFERPSNILSPQRLGYACKSQSLRQICEHALEGCDGCGLVVYSIANAENATSDSEYQGRTVAPEDQITVHLPRWESDVPRILKTSNTSRTLNIAHHCKSGPAFDGQISLSMAAEEGSAAAKYVSGRVDFAGTESSGTLALAKRWLHECVTSGKHTKCISSDTKLPTRVLDVRNGLRLQETKCSYGKYATLSYCWGGEQPGKLLTSNRIASLAHIVEADQPKTIRDAIKVTRALGLSFLWVDSWCILQNSEQDKAAEIGKMARIYQDAHITLDAACASSVEQGFLKPTSNLVLMPFRVKLPDLAPGELWLQRTLSHSSHSLDPINRRAWTLQERALSRRVICFPSNLRDIEFQCESSGRHNMNAMARRGGDVRLGVIDYYLPGLSMSGMISAQLNRYTGRSYYNEQIILSWWYGVVDQYSRRALTKVDDKLTALAGIASEFATHLGTYLAGMWEKRLVFQLLWFTCASLPGYESVRRPHVYTGPSWSWTSLTGPISSRIFDAVDENLTPEQDQRDSLKLCIIWYRLVLTNNISPFGAVKFAELNVCGWLMHAKVAKSDSRLTPSEEDILYGSKLELEPLDVWEHSKVSYEEAIGSAVLDIRSEYPPYADTYCLVVDLVAYELWGVFQRIKHQERHRSNYFVQGGLLLTRDSKSEAQQNRYCRIGVFHIDPDYEQRFIEAAQKRTINLV